MGDISAAPPWFNGITQLIKRIPGGSEILFPQFTRESLSDDPLSESPNLFTLQYVHLSV